MPIPELFQAFNYFHTKLLSLSFIIANSGVSMNIGNSVTRYHEALRAFRKWSTNCITAILPYLPYARQDKPTAEEREPATAKIFADLLKTAGVDRVVVWHPHSPQVHGFFGETPVDALDAADFFSREFAMLAGRNNVIVAAPDAGALKFVTALGKNWAYAVASKHRPSPEQAAITDLLILISGIRLIPDAVSHQDLGKEEENEP